LPDRPFTVLNFKQVKLDARVSDGDEVALLPPFSGG
jgi:molybdopterin converting factor small subunit